MYTLDPRGTSGWTAPDVLKAKRLLAASGAAGTEVALWWHRDFGEQAGRYLEQLLDSLGFRAHLRLFSGDKGKYFGAIQENGAAFATDQSPAIRVSDLCEAWTSVGASP